MKVIRITPEPEATPHYVGTIAEAKSWVKDNVATKLRFAVRVAEINMNTDKEAILLLLNNSGTPANATVLRQWSVTPRGGFADLEV